MMQPSKPSPTAPTARAKSPEPAASEIVTRPEPGLARGKWEAPEAAFWVALALLILLAAAYLLRRFGILKLKRDRKSTPPSVEKPEKVRRS